MIIVQLKGGLGNQLFQYALSRRLAIEYNTEVYIDIRKIPLYKTKRRFELFNFPHIKYEIKEFSDNNYTVINENKITITPSHLDKKNNYYFEGYWQSERYFKNISETIKNELMPRLKSIQKLTASISSDNAVSLHVRRTDYLYNKNVFNILDIDYYKQAVDVVGSYEKLFIFSDDIKWCKQNLHFDKMIFVEGNNSVTDLWLMSLCRDNIIANSSFSYWGAWLNDNPDKKVITPDKWFLNKKAIIAPDNWIKI